MADEEKNSFILLWRSARRHPWFKNKPPWVHHMWLNLLMDASFVDHKVEWRRHIIELKRGQYIVTETGLAKEYQVSRQMVSYYLKQMEAEKMIKKDPICLHGVLHTVLHGGFLVTICNYGRWQPEIEGDLHTVLHSSLQQTIKRNIQKKGSTEKGSLDYPDGTLSQLIDHIKPKVTNNINPKVD